MPYALVQDLCRQYGYREISQLLSDEEGLLTEDMLRTAVSGGVLAGYTAEEQEAIAAAMNRASDALSRQTQLMDSKIGSRYALPLPQVAVDQAPLQECCLALTRAYLCDDTDNTSPLIEGSRTRWIKWLADLAKDQSVIPGAPKVTVGGTDNTYKSAKPNGLDLSEY